MQWVSKGETLVSVSELRTEPTTFFHGIPFLPERMSDRHIISPWAFGRYLLKNKRRKGARRFKENEWLSKSPVTQFELLWESENFGKLLFATVSLTDF